MQWLRRVLGNMTGTRPDQRAAGSAAPTRAWRPRCVGSQQCHWHNDGTWHCTCYGNRPHPDKMLREYERKGVQPHG